jgi:uncharacterized protein (DUF1499 family)
VSRRPNIEEPVSRLAAWSSRLAIFALVAVMISVIVVRGDLLEIMPAMAMFASALALAGIAILLSLGAAVTIWRQGLSGIGRAVLGFFLGAILLAYPGYLALRAYQMPPVRDVTTDTARPPRFEVTARLRPRGTNDYQASNVALQRGAYPDIVPLQVLQPPMAAYEAALAVVRKHKWVVVDARPPVARREGSIEAVARSLIMGFRDDVVIRVNALGAGSQVDIRSASRYAWHDFGTNASRVRELLEEIDDATSGDVKLTPARQPAQPQRPPAAAQQRQPTQRQPTSR